MSPLIRSMNASTMLKPDLTPFLHPILLEPLATIHTMTTLFHLPIQIIALIATLLSRDFLDFRQTCRKIKADTALVFAQKYFQTRRVMFERHSLQTLLSISKYPPLCQSIRTLEICPNHLLPLEKLQAIESAIKEIDYIDIICGGVESNTEDTEALDGDRLSRLNAKAYRKCFEDQEQLNRTEYDVECLKEIMTRLTNCRSIIISDENRPWGLKHVRNSIGIFPQRTLPFTSSPTSVKLIRHMIQVVLTAAVTSKARVETLDIDIGFSMRNASCINPHMLIGPCSALLAQSPITSLSHLHLVLDKASSGLSTDPSGWASALVQFTNFFPRLSHFSLGFEDRDDFGRFSELCTVLYMPKLEVLSLQSINCSSMALAFFLLRHHRALRKIRFNWIELTDGVGAWRWLIGVIRDSLDITSLGMRGCSGHQKYSLPDLEDTDARSLTDIIDSLPI